MKDIITLRGDRDLWIDFVSKVKKERKEVWEILSTFIRPHMTFGQTPFENAKNKGFNSWKGLIYNATT